MENKSKLSRLALTRVMLQALLLLLAAPLSAFAATEANQEIGVPQPMEVRAKGCFGVVLSPDGDGFYSVRDGLLTHYRIDPFKKISSVAIDEAPLKDIAEKDSCRVLITDDGSNLILVFRNWLVSLDRRTGKMTRKVERQAIRTDVGQPSEAVTLNQNDLVILSGFNNPERGAWFYLTVLDVNTFSLKRPALDIKGKFELGHTSCCTGMHITNIQDRLYVSSGKTLAVLNSKTYEPELTLNCQRFRSFARLPIISRDHRKLYAINATFVNDYLAQTKKDYGEPIDNTASSVLIFDQVTRQSSREPYSKEREDERYWRRDLYEPLLFGGAVTRNKNYVAGQGRIASRNAKIDYRFFQYESSEAILEEVQLPEFKRTYHLTPNARQHLMMKNREGKVVPINDATFDKYRADSAR